MSETYHIRRKRRTETQPNYPSVVLGTNKEQLCAASTTDTFPRFTTPDPWNSQRKLVSEMEGQPQTIGLSSKRYNQNAEH